MSNTSQQDVEFRIMPNGDNWYWEVITEGLVVSRGVSDTEACQAASDAARRAERGRLRFGLSFACAVTPAKSVLCRRTWIHRRAVGRVSEGVPKFQREVGRG
jgi:hypothetical protein